MFANHVTRCVKQSRILLSANQRFLCLQNTRMFESLVIDDVLNKPVFVYQPINVCSGYHREASLNEAVIFHYSLPIQLNY